MKTPRGLTAAVKESAPATVKTPQEPNVQDSAAPRVGVSQLGVGCSNYSYPCGLISAKRTKPIQALHDLMAAHQAKQQLAEALKPRQQKLKKSQRQG